MKDGDLTPRQLAVLVTVAQNEGLSQTGLVDRTGIDRSTLADIVRRMQKKGLLQRRRTKEDARAYAVKLTEEGRRVLRAAEPLAKRVDERILDALPEQAARAVHRRAAVHRRDAAELSPRAEQPLQNSPCSRAEPLAGTVAWSGAASVAARRPDVAQAAFFSSLRLTSSSAICTALSAAPLRRLSDTIHSARPFSTVASSRMRLM